MGHYLVFLCFLLILGQCLSEEDSSEEKVSKNEFNELQQFVSNALKKLEIDVQLLKHHQFEIAEKLKSLLGIELESKIVDDHNKSQHVHIADIHGDDERHHHIDHHHDDHHRDEHGHSSEHHDHHSHEEHDGHHDSHESYHHHDTHEHYDDHKHDSSRGHDSHGHDISHHHEDDSHLSNDTVHEDKDHDHHHMDGNSHSDEHHGHRGDHRPHSDEHHGQHSDHNSDHSSHSDEHHGHHNDHHSDHSDHSSHSDEHRDHGHDGHHDGHDKHGDDKHHEDDSHHSNDTSPEDKDHDHHQTHEDRDHQKHHKHESHHHQHHEAHHRLSGELHHQRGDHSHDDHHHHHHHHHRGHTKYGDNFDFATCEVEPNKAIPEEKQQDIRGRINLWQRKNSTFLHIHIRVKGFKMDGDHSTHGDDSSPSSHLHGFHVHQEGDLSNGCQSTGPHYNPTKVAHGGRNSDVRHVGDLGNISCDKHGVTNIVFTDKVASLSGQYSIIGRSLVIHEKFDDLGTNPDIPDSLTSGNAGTRIACCIIQKVTRLPRMPSKTKHSHH